MALTQGVTERGYEEQGARTTKVAAHPREASGVKERIHAERGDTERANQGEQRSQSFERWFCR